MKVQLERTFPILASADATWKVLTDVESVAACMPGASITERIDERHYKGKVTVKLGPATLAFRGDIEVRDADPAARTLTLIASGTDTSGSSAASLNLLARVEAAADGSSVLIGKSEASVNGKAAAFGGRMMESVADQILRQFAANFAARAALEVPVAPGPEAAAAPLRAAALEMPAAPHMSAALAGYAAPTAPAAAPELNALRLLWGVIKDWWRGLFSNKAS